MNSGSLEVEGLTKVFGEGVEGALDLLEDGKTKQEIQEKTGCTVAVHDVSFKASEGRIFVLMGLSGSGKSTVLRCLNRLIEPTRGTVRVDGDDIGQYDDDQLRRLRQHKMSMVFQSFALLPHRSVLSNVSFGLEIQGVAADERDEKAREVLELVGLSSYEDSKPEALSGGMQQRVGLARALATDPEFLLMDEAFGALDPLIRAEMQEELLKIQERMQKTILFITHDLDEALGLGDDIAIMKEGRVVQIGEAEEIVTRPEDDYVAAFVANVDRTHVITAKSLMQGANAARLEETDAEAAKRRLTEEDLPELFVTDAEGRLKGLVRLEEVETLDEDTTSDIKSVLLTNVPKAGPETTISDLLPGATRALPVAVVDEHGVLQGVVRRPDVLRGLMSRDQKEGAGQQKEASGEKKEGSRK